MGLIFIVKTFMT